MRYNWTVLVIVSFNLGFILSTSALQSGNSELLGHLNVPLLNQASTGGVVTFSAHLWNTTVDIAHAILQTSFLQDVANGTLDPQRFAAYMVQDVYYLEKAVESWKRMNETATDAKLKEFFSGRVLSYTREYHHIANSYGVKQVIPHAMMEKYVSLQTNASQNEQQDVAIAAFAPCILLWNWIGEQIPSPNPTNVYAGWITNLPHPKGVERVNDILDYVSMSANYDRVRAQQLFEAAMQAELDYFAAF